MRKLVVIIGLLFFLLFIETGCMDSEPSNSIGFLDVNSSYLNLKFDDIESDMRGTSESIIYSKEVYKLRWKSYYTKNNTWIV